MPLYEHTTREEFRNIIRHKLKEAGVFWSDLEVNISINEALLTFGALSAFWKDKVNILTEENKIRYDLSIDSTPETTELISPALPYSQIVKWINRDLIEDISDLAPDSEFLSLNSLLSLIETKYNIYQQSTGLIINTLEVNVIADQIKIQLSENVIDIIRVSIFDPETQIETSLDIADEEEIHRFAYRYLNSKGLPKFYSTLYGATKELKLYPVPDNLYIIRITYVSSNSIAPTYNGIIPLPDNLVPYIKFGVEADIFNNDGILYDPARAAYCSQRWEEGIIIGRNYNSVEAILINDVTKVDIDSLMNIELYGNNNKSRRPITAVGFAGFNLFFTKEIPSEVQYNLSLLTNINAPLPIDDADFIRVDLEYIDMIAGYVLHLLYIKTGAGYIELTNNLKDKFIQTSMNHNRRLLLQGITYDNLIQATKKQERDAPKIVVED